MISFSQVIFALARIDLSCQFIIMKNQLVSIDQIYLISSPFFNSIHIRIIEVKILITITQLGQKLLIPCNSKSKSAGSSTNS